jgi:hypothetical protein
VVCLGLDDLDDDGVVVVDDGVSACVAEERCVAVCEGDAARGLEARAVLVAAAECDGRSGAEDADGGWRATGSDGVKDRPGDPHVEFRAHRVALA